VPFWRASTSFIRIAQETFPKAAQHTCAQPAQIRLHRLPNLAEWTVSDDGVGFVFERILPNHLGLGSIREGAWHGHYGGGAVTQP
jgi:signal transduction histidine kinase